MLPSESIDVIERAAARFAELLTYGPMDTPVRACPGWTIADLGRHLGGIHRWATTALVVGKPGEEPAGPENPADIEPWFRDGARALVATLRSCDPDQDAWTFGPPRSARFWIRRQAHETTLHVWDAASSRGVRHAIDDTLATDGIDEVLTMFLPRQVRLGRLAPTSDIVELRCDSGFQTVLITDPARMGNAPHAVISGPAETLLLLLWKRTDVYDPRLRLTGDAAAVQRLLSLPITP